MIVDPVTYDSQGYLVILSIASIGKACNLQSLESHKPNIWYKLGAGFNTHYFGTLNDPWYKNNMFCNIYNFRYQLCYTSMHACNNYIAYLLLAEDYFLEVPGPDLSIDDLDFSFTFLPSPSSGLEFRSRVLLESLLLSLHMLSAQNPCFFVTICNWEYGICYTTVYV